MELSPAWLLGWRCLYALALALAPWALPLDAPLPDSPDALMLRAFLGWLGVALMVSFAVALARRSDARRWPLVTGLLAFALALASAWWLPARGLPLGVSVWALGPLVWATLVGARAVTLPRARRAPALAGLMVMGAVTVAFAAPRVRSVEAMWRATTERAPTDAEAWRALVKITAARGDRVGARRLLDRCLQSSPRATACALDRAEILLRDRAFAAAARDAATVLATQPESPRANVLRASALARQMPIPSDALEAARKAVEYAPREAEAHYALALCLDAAGRVDEARTHAQTAATLGGGSDVRLLQSLLALRTGDAAMARSTVEGVLRNAGEDARAWYTLGLVEQQAGHYNAAREAYLHSLRIDRTGYAARYNMATLAMGAGAREEARHHLELLLRDHPGDPAGVALQRQLDGLPPLPSTMLVRPPSL